MNSITSSPGYTEVLVRVVDLLERARRESSRAVNSVMTSTYWEIGRQIVEGEQKGADRAGYGTRLVERLSQDLTAKFGRGFGVVNLTHMRRFYLAWLHPPILQTPSEESAMATEGELELLNMQIPQTLSAESPPTGLNADQITAKSRQFPLPWSHYVKLLSVENSDARAFYEAEALRGGWSVRQLDRQIASKFHERTLLSRNKAAMLRRNQAPADGDAVTAEEEIRDPFVLEFLGLKDEYSETDLEDALIVHLESFLLELGGDFAFVGRQRRLRIGDAWYRIDLMFFHRRLRCLVVIDLKLGKFTHADAGQMHLYLNYAREHWTHDHENPPVGLILCSQKDDAIAHYALEGLPNKVLASEYKMALPDEQVLVAELKRTQNRLTSKGFQQ